MRTAFGFLLVTAGSMALGIGACSSKDEGGGSGADPDAGGIQVDADQGCPAGKITSISGVIYTPAKSSPDPIYNAAAFVPSGEIAAFPRGVRCDKCGALEGTKVRVATLSNSKGQFRLEGVPAGKNIPFAVQIGRWRRKVVIPEVRACEDNPLPAELTRLPRNKEEGDIPLTALVTGRADLLECTLRKIGVEDKEFVEPLPDGNGRIHVFKSLNGIDIGSGTIGGSSLYKNLDFLKKYDQVLLPCEGNARTTDKDDKAMANLVSYANAGGKVFTTHYGYVWLQSSTDPIWKGLTTWATLTDSVASLPATIDESFPKGKAMAEWLQNVGATKTQGQLDIIDARLDITSPVKAPAQVWVKSTKPESTQHFTFNTPIDKPVAEQCGRVIYSDFHVVGLDDFSTPYFFPNECTPGPLSAQERVIEFMLFDLASCVQPDADPPKIPK